MYLNDIIFVSETFDEYVRMLNEVRLHNANLTLNLEERQFFRNSLSYFGFIVGYRDLRTNLDKVQTIVNYPVPRTTTDIKRFVEMCSGYQPFIPHFSTQMSPINNLIIEKFK